LADDFVKVRRLAADVQTVPVIWSSRHDSIA